ncbi:lytic murein transglycosylase [Bosea sp. CCNWLW174]|uniref:lytic murein transglycosylase n=1 Tax=unclassified Bosea (in: a-proteobacteria) TaxID=2653178 RepID=UPI00301580FD
MRTLILALPLVLAAATAARADFDSCVAGLRSAAAAKGVSGATFDRAMAGVTPDMKVIEAMNNQPEFKTPIWDYLGTLVDDEKVAEGRSMMRQHASTLAAAEQRFGVDRHTIAAVWGVESDFGKARGKMPLVQALSTGACLAPRRNAFFKGELIATLQIIQRGDVRPERLFGSWAGAFGHTQFIPSTYLRLAVDGDGDGRRDLVDSIPDALHSTANFMDKAGWVTGATWGYEVRVPGGYSGPTGRNPKQPVSSWAARGIVKFDGSALTGSGNAGLLMPAGRNGPAFLVFKNYDAAYSYNGADSYALAISLLSDRLRGRPGVQGEWPTDDLPLSREQRRELQRLLIQRGYNVGEPDGAVGALTRAAIKDIEGKVGMPQTGRPGEKVLRALKGGRV